MSARWLEVYENELGKINHFLACPKPVNRDVDTIFAREAIGRIEDEMDRLMKDYTFTHRFVKPQHMDDDSWTTRSVRRLIKMRFRCKNPRCEQFRPRQSSQQKVSEIERHWTSYNGLVDFRFYFEKVPSVHHNSINELTFSFRIYNQKCLTCKEWGRSGLIETVLDELVNLYSLIIQNALVMMKRNEEICWGVQEKYGVKDKSNDPDIKKTSHLAELCSACKEEVCIRFYEEKEVKEEDVKKEAKQWVAKKIETEAKNKVTVEDDYSYIVPSSTRVSR